MIMRLISNWRHAWKMTSVQLAALIAILPQLNDALPALQPYLSANVYSILGVAVVLARVVLQPKLPK